MFQALHFPTHCSNVIFMAKQADAYLFIYLFIYLFHHPAQQQAMRKASSFLSCFSPSFLFTFLFLLSSSLWVLDPQPPNNCKNLATHVDTKCIDHIANIYSETYNSFAYEQKNNFKLLFTAKPTSN